MRHRLDNGLTVLLKENHAAPVVAFQAWVNAGSADETDAEAGLAHVHEHMLFKGTARRGVGEIARDVEAAGGDINAWTGFDQTVYHLVMASRELVGGLDILADALRFSAFDPDELVREKEVILEEIKRTYDMPSRRAARELFSLAFEKHPYRRPVIGFEETVRGFSRDDVLAFYGKHYRPENVTVILVGDFEEEQALGRVQEYFGDWEGDGRIVSPRTPEPAQRGMRFRTLDDDVREAHLELAWHAPSVMHEDVPALDLLAVILAHGDSSRLVHALTRKAHIANEVGGYAYTPKDPGLFMMSAQCASEKTEACLEGMLSVLYRLREERVGEDELEKARQMVEAETVYQRETVQGQARRLGFFETVAGSIEYEDTYYRRVRQVSAEDVRTVAERYLHGEGLSLVGLLPEGAGIAEDALRAVCERAGNGARPRTKRRDDGRQPIVERTLTNGARLLVQEDRAVPLFSARAVYLGGLRYETETLQGINQLMARSLTNGTHERSAEEIARLVDEWAGNIQGVAGRNSFGLHGEFLTRHFDKGLRLFAECLTGSVFPETELATERALLAEEIKAEEDNPVGVTFGEFTRALYERHPYRLDMKGTLESLPRLESKTLQSYLAAHYVPSRLTLSVVGDVDPDATFELAEALFGAAGDEGAQAPPAVEVEACPESPRRAERSLNKAQAHLVLGFPGLTLDDDDRFALELLSTVLSGQSGRLFLELRDKRSLAYSVSAFSVEGIDPGYFAVYMGTSPEKVDEALEGIRAELAKLRDGTLPEREVERAKRYLVGSHEIGLQRAASRAAVIAFNSAYGLGAGAHLEYAQRVTAVTAAQLQDVARRVLDPKREVLAVGGPGRGE